MDSKKLNYKLINITALFLLLYLVFSNINLWWGVFSYIVSLLSPFIIGFGFAYIFTPLVRWLESKGIKHGLSVTGVVLFLVVIVVVMLLLTLPMLYDQLKLCIKMISQINLEFHLNLGNFEIKLTDYLNNIIDGVGSVLSSSMMGVFNQFIGFISKLIIGLVAFIYFLTDMDKIRSSVKEILESINKRAFNYVKLLDTEIRNYTKGLLIFMIIQFFEYSILFLVVGHPNWLILGLLACLTTIIPYFGGLITNIIAIIMASTVSVPLTIATIVICLIFPQLDGYVISPKVYGKTNNVNPLITIMAVSIGGSIVGIWGIIIALPCYLLIRTTYKFFKKDLKKGVKKMKETI